MTATTRDTHSGITWLIWTVLFFGSFVLTRALSDNLVADPRCYTDCFVAGRDFGTWLTWLWITAWATISLGLDNPLTRATRATPTSDRMAVVRWTLFTIAVWGLVVCFVGTLVVWLNAQAAMVG